MSIGFHTGARTNVGIKREVNQDSYATAPGIVVVADGMGGHRGGEVASSLAVQEVIARFDRPEIDRLVASVARANTRILAEADADWELRGMGTTLVALGMVHVDGETKLGVVNVGDSRMYRRVGKKLQQLTEDHSLVEELIQDGRLSRSEARDHPQRNVVTRALGVATDVKVDAWVYDPNLGDRYLLCSDGLVDEVDHEPILRILHDEPDPQVAADRLVDAANAGGGNDNITVVVVDIVADGQATMAPVTKSLASDLLPTAVAPFDTPDQPQGAPIGAAAQDPQEPQDPQGDFGSLGPQAAAGSGESGADGSRQRWSWRR